jgi:MFS transporter, DHA2 family, multidrug resistance protein
MSTQRGGSVPFRDWIAVFGAILGAFMAVLDIQITNSSLQYIQGGLAASLDEGTWISTGYLVAEIVVIPLTGYLGGVFGLRRYLLVNVVLFVVFSMLCGIATSLYEMILFRAAQGFTGGVLIPTAFTVVNLKLPPEKRPVGLAMFGLTATLGPAIGPTIGGWLTDNYGWPYIFYINLVPGIALLWMIWYGMDPQPMRLERLRNGDWFGIACMALGLGSLEIVLEEGERRDWFGSDLIFYLAIVAAVFTIAFVAIELMRKEPFINLRLLKRAGLAGSSVVGLALGFGLYGSVYIIPVYLSQIQGYNAYQIGHVIMWLGLPQLFIFPIVPILMKRIDPRILLGFGLLVFALSNFMNAYMSHNTAEPQLKWAMLVRALGQPFVMTPISQMATAGVEPSETAGASSIFNIMRNLGGSIGIALLQTFTTWREHFHFDVIAQRVTQNGLLAQERIHGMAQQFVADAGDPSAATQMAIAQIRNLVRRDAFVMAYSDCFYIMGAVLLISMLAIFFLQKPKAGAAAGGH